MKEITLVLSLRELNEIALQANIAGQKAYKEQRDIKIRIVEFDPYHDAQSLIYLYEGMQIVRVEKKFK